MAVVTALYASIMAIIIVALGINVTRHRVMLRVPLGDGGNPVMLRMIRMHANAIEYIPLAIALMLIYELDGGSRILLHVVGIVLILARFAHMANMWVSEVARLGRRAGQGLTWLALVVLAVANLIKLL